MPLGWLSYFSCLKDQFSQTPILLTAWQNKAYIAHDTKFELGLEFLSSPANAHISLTTLSITHRKLISQHFVLKDGSFYMIFYCEPEEMFHTWLEFSRQLKLVPFDTMSAWEFDPMQKCASMCSIGRYKVCTWSAKEWNAIFCTLIVFSTILKFKVLNTFISSQEWIRQRDGGYFSLSGCRRIRDKVWNLGIGTSISHRFLVLSDQ